ncbi:MAG: hypothetical protein U0236_03240 [Nitrospira sp.]
MTTIIDDVHARLEANGQEYGMDDIGTLCPDLTWNQVFLVVDFMSRTGEIQLRLDPSRGYRVAAMPAPQSRPDLVSIVA